MVTLDPTAVARWLAILHGDSPGHVHICSAGDWTGRTFPAAELDRAAAYVAALDASGREGIYARVTSVHGDFSPWKHGCGTTSPCGQPAEQCPSRIRGRGGAADSAALPALWADLDLAGPGHAEQDLPPDEDAGRAVIAASGLPEPTIWIHSGGGLYPIWLLDAPWLLEDGAALEAARSLAKDWQAVIEHAAAGKGWRYGRGVGDLARVLRIPGTVNRKEGLARPCRIVSAAPQRYTVAQLQEALAAARARIAPAAPVALAAVPAVSLGTVARPAGAISPGDDYAARVSWHEILEPVGWTEHYQQDGVTYWTRPGKSTGTSASTNALGTDRLHVFTTSAAPLEGNESYSKLGAFAALHHGGSHSAAARALAEAGYGTPLVSPAREQREALGDILGAPVPDPAPVPPPARVWTTELDVSNSAVAAEWLRNEAGRGKLAGLFRRGGVVVHTPREGDEGYVPLSDGDEDQDGPAQVREVDDSRLASRITYTYGVYKLVKVKEDWEPKPALFPKTAARTALDVPDMLPNLRVLKGVIHAPVFRPDGSLVEVPGYDPATGLLHLPDPGLHVPPVPDLPDEGHVRGAVQMLDEMLSGFPFLTDHYRANYVGALITPLLRAMAPPPYKLHAIEAHQPGSGKTLLANLSRWIHGGVFRAELPDDDAEMRKQITAILTVTTGIIAIFDNVGGHLKSSIMAGLLTSDRWDDRVLGSTSWATAKNDRLWTITGNNLSIGGDLPRRTLRTVIDPGMPNPERRTGFAIGDLEGWVKAHRGKLLHALITIVRAWVIAGMPMRDARTTDSYSRWVRMVDGIIAHAGIPGRFDDPSTQTEIGTDDDEWGDFLRAAYGAFGSATWTAKELLGKVNTGSLIEPGPIPAEALPGDLEAKLSRPGASMAGVSKSLGKWLRNRDGRWAGGLVSRHAGFDRTKTALWQIHSNATESDGVKP